MSSAMYSSRTGVVNLSYAAMWIFMMVFLGACAAYLFYLQLPWAALILLALAAFCVWPFRLCLRDGRAERRAYRADLADQAARRND